MLNTISDTFWADLKPKPKGFLGSEGCPRGVSKPSPSSKTSLSKYLAPMKFRTKNWEMQRLLYNQPKPMYKDLIMAL